VARHALMKPEPIYANFRVPKGAKVIGYLDPETMELPIIQQTVTVKVKKPVIDPATGEQAWKKFAGNPVVPRFTLVDEKRVVEWVPRKDAHANIRKDYNFRQTPEEIELLENAKRVKQMTSDLAKAMVAEGLDVTTLVRTIKDLNTEQA
jgi:hypothetical protein